MVKIDYSQDRDLIEITVVGQVQFNDIRETFMEIGSRFSHKKNLYVITDYTNGSIKPNPGFLVVNLDKAKKLFSVFFAPFENFYNAYVFTEDSQGTKVIIEQFTKITKDINMFRSEFFSSRQEAEDWIYQMQNNHTS